MKKSNICFAGDSHNRAIAVNRNFIDMLHKKSEKLADNLAETVGNIIKNPEKSMKFLDFRGHNMSLPVLALFTFGIILGARLYQARDTNERREVATRDFIACLTILFALPIFRKCSATIVRKLFGFPIAYGERTLTNHLKIDDGLTTYSFRNIRNQYSKVKDMKEKMVTFCEQIDKNGGDLRKVLHFMNDESKMHLNKIAELSGMKCTGKEGDSLTFKLIKFITKPYTNSKVDLVIPNSNKEIIELFKNSNFEKLTQNIDNSKSFIEKTKTLGQNMHKTTKNIKNSKEINSRLNSIIEEFDRDNNQVLKIARFLKSVPEALSIAAIAGFLGWFVPWFNIIYTKQLYKNNSKNVITDKSSNTECLQNSQLATNRYKLSGDQINLYRNFVK